MSVDIESPSWQYYQVSAQTLADVVTLLEGEPEAGRCDWLPSWTSSEQDGVVTAVDVRVPIVIHLPEWPEASSATDAERSEWERFIDALNRHELGHGALVEEHLRDVDSVMVGVSRSDAESAFDERLATLQRASDDYDSRTDHGRHDGTVITIP